MHVHNMHKSLNKTDKVWDTLVLSAETFSPMVAVWGEMYPKPVLIWYHWWGQGCTSQPGSQSVKKYIKIITYNSYEYSYKLFLLSVFLLYKREGVMQQKLQQIHRLHICAIRLRAPLCKNFLIVMFFFLCVCIFLDLCTQFYVPE